MDDLFNRYEIHLLDNIVSWIKTLSPTQLRPDQQDSWLVLKEGESCRGRGEGGRQQGVARVGLGGACCRRNLLRPLCSSLHCHFASTDHRSSLVQLYAPFEWELLELCLSLISSGLVLGCCSRRKKQQEGVEDELQVFIWFLFWIWVSCKQTFLAGTGGGSWDTRSSCQERGEAFFSLKRGRGRVWREWRCASTSDPGLSFLHLAPSCLRPLHHLPGPHHAKAALCSIPLSVDLNQVAVLLLLKHLPLLLSLLCSHLSQHLQPNLLLSSLLLLHLRPRNSLLNFTSLHTLHKILLPVLPNLLKLSLPSLLPISLPTSISSVLHNIYDHSGLNSFVKTVLLHFQQQQKNYYSSFQSYQIQMNWTSHSTSSLFIKSLCFSPPSSPVPI